MKHRRGAALLMALFALVVGAGSATAFLKGRSEITKVGGNLRDAALARSAASEGLCIARELLAAIFTESDATLANAWRTQLSDGVLLDNFELNGAILNVTIEDMNTGAPPTINTTEFEAHVTVVVGGTSYAMTAQLSLSSLVKGQYAMFANKFMTMEGENFIGRWENAPASAGLNPVNIGTQADLQNWGFTGIYIGGDAYFEDEPVEVLGSYTTLDGAIASQPTLFRKAARTGAVAVSVGGATHVQRFAGGDPLLGSNWEVSSPYEYDLQCFLYYPDDATEPTIWGAGDDKVAKVRLPAGESIDMIDPLDEGAVGHGRVHHRHGLHHQPDLERAGEDRHAIPLQAQLDRVVRRPHHQEQLRRHLHQRRVPHRRQVQAGEQPHHHRRQCQDRLQGRQLVGL